MSSVTPTRSPRRPSSNRSVGFDTGAKRDDEPCMVRTWNTISMSSATLSFIWTVVGGEAHINWDDGWHDAIRRVGNKYQKVAFSPGSSFSGRPSNVTDAVYTESN